MMKINRCIIFAFLLLLFTSTNVFAQNIRLGDEKKGVKIHQVSIGASNIYDTYLSPLEYKGLDVKYNYITSRNTNWFNERFVKYQNIGVDLSKANNPRGNASYYWALINYQLGGHYFFNSYDKLSIGVGALGDIALGVLYNNRNGNNPATGRAYGGLVPSVVVLYTINKLPIRLQLNTNLVGFYLQQEYGQSYYEIWLGNRSGLFNFTSLHNMKHLKSNLSTEVTLGKKTLQIGLLGDFMQTKINHTITHNYSLSVSIGIPIYSDKK